MAQTLVAPSDSGRSQVIPLKHEVELKGLTGQLAQALSKSFSQQGGAQSLYQSLEVLMGVGQVQEVLDEVERQLANPLHASHCRTRLSWAAEQLKALQHAAAIAESSETEPSWSSGRGLAASADVSRQQRCLAVFSTLTACVERQARLQQQLPPRQAGEPSSPAAACAVEFLSPDRTDCLGRKNAFNEFVNDLFAEEFVLTMKGMERCLQPLASLIDVMYPVRREIEPHAHM